MSMRRGGIPGPESRTGLVRPAMSEAEFERRQALAPVSSLEDRPPAPESDEPGPSVPSTLAMAMAEPEPTLRSSATRNRAPRGKPVKSRRVQRMFAIEEELDKKLWLYAIHVGKDRSDVVNDLLRPIVASMVLYDSRDRRAARAAEASAEPGAAEA